MPYKEELTLYKEELMPYKEELNAQEGRSHHYKEEP